MKDYIITNLIPQRHPFLFISKIISIETNKILTELNLIGDEDFFKGHFPSDPIMPGVLMQEALFQSGAALLSSSNSDGLGVVTRVQNAKFKNLVRPGDKIAMEVELIENLSNAYYMKGISKVNDKIVLTMEFSVATIKRQ